MLAHVLARPYARAAMLAKTRSLRRGLVPLALRTRRSEGNLKTAPKGTRGGQPDWGDKYPSVIAVLANVRAKSPTSTANYVASETMDC